MKWPKDVSGFLFYLVSGILSFVLLINFSIEGKILTASGGRIRPFHLTGITLANPSFQMALWAYALISIRISYSGLLQNQAKEYYPFSRWPFPSYFWHSMFFDL